MVAPLVEQEAGTGQGSEALMNRLSAMATRIDGIASVTQDTRERLERLDGRFDDAIYQQQRSLEQLEERVEMRMHARLTDAVRAAMQPELAVIRPPIEAQAARLAAVESRLERVETIQVESMNALDVRFGDLAFQTRLALSAGGLVTLGAIMVVLLK